MTHFIDSAFLYIHPPLAIVGYVCVVVSMISVLNNRGEKKFIIPVKAWFYSAWLFNLLGLLSGMIWAQLAWNSYWSWDPKETITLLLFLTISISVLQYEKRKKMSLIFLFLALLFVVVNVMITIGNFGLHSYNL